MQKKYVPDPSLNGISSIPTDFERRRMLPDARQTVGYPWTKVPRLPVKKPMGRRIISLYLLSTTFGFAAAWFGAATFDHINLKIDNFRDRMETVPYK